MRSSKSRAALSLKSAIYFILTADPSILSYRDYLANLATDYVYDLSLLALLDVGTTLQLSPLYPTFHL